MKYFSTLRSKRFFKIFLIVVSIIGILYQLLFSTWGNTLVSNMIEKSLSSKFSTPMHVQEFMLTHNRFDLMARDDFGNTLSTQGGFSLLTLRLFAHYRLECPHTEGLNPLDTPFKTSGAISGGIAALNILGSATLFGGNLLYKLELHRAQLSSIDLKLHHLDYEPLLHFLDYPSDTDTRLSGTVDLRGFDRRDVMGKIHLNTQTQQFMPTAIKEDDNSSFDLKSLLADKFGRIKPFDIHVTIDASLAHAGILEQFVGIPLGGAATLQSTLEGNEKLLHLKAHTNVAQSDTSLMVTISDLEPSSIKLDFKHADMEQIFILFALNAPISGQGDVYGELNTTGGNLNVNITKGTTIPNVLIKEYQINQPLIHFNADVTADISKKGVHYRAAFKSDLSRMEIDNTTTHDQMLRELLKSLR